MTLFCVFMVHLIFFRLFILDFLILLLFPIYHYLFPICFTILPLCFCMTNLQSSILTSGVCTCPNDKYASSKLFLAFKHKHTPCSRRIIAKNVSWFGYISWYKIVFFDHISIVIGKAWAVLGFVKRWAKEFIDPLFICSLFNLIKSDTDSEFLLQQISG